MHQHSDQAADWVGAWSERRAALSPDSVGLKDETTGESYTYAALDRRANQTARLLREHGVERGERVAVVSRNRVELVDLFFATGKTGGVLAPISHRLATPDTAALLETVDPSLLVVEEPFEEAVTDALDRSDVDCPVLSLSTASDHEWTAFRSVVPEDDSSVETTPIAPSDPHLFLHTGGSTGTPKETVLTHGGIYWNSFNTITAWGIRSDDVTPMVFPMFHTGGWNVLTVPLFHMGGTVIISRDVDPAAVLDCVEREQATLLVAVPAVFRMMTEDDTWQDTDLSSLRLVKSGGGPCRDAVIQAWRNRGVDLTQGYGLTECGPNNFAMPDDHPPERTNSIGVPAMHVDARIVDEDGQPVDGEIGELELAGPHAADRYWRNEDASAATFGDWVSTGDLARVDEDGYYHIEGRKKNMFVSGGENVYPPKVEDAVADHDLVNEVVVIGVSDDTWGTVGKAVVEGDPSLTLDALQTFLSDRLAGFEIPKQLTFVDEMPTSGPSKIDRQTVIEQFSEQE